MTSFDSVSKIISYRFNRPVPVNHQYGICRMHSEENPQDFRLPIPCLYPRERVMQPLCAEAAFKPGGHLPWEFTSENLPQGFIPGRPSLAYEGSGDTVFCAVLPVGVIGIYGIGSHASYPHIHELLLHADAVLQTYTLIENLEQEVFDERYAAICMLLAFDRTQRVLVSLPLTMGRT